MAEDTRPCSPSVCTQELLEMVGDDDGDDEEGDKIPSLNLVFLKITSGRTRVSNPHLHLERCAV